MKGETVESKLCQKCQETLGLYSNSATYIHSWWHCHHEEPEIDYQKPWREAVEKLLTWTRLHQEKPEEESGERCWCEWPHLSLKLDDIHGKYEIGYCPVCGRKL